MNLRQQIFALVGSIGLLIFTVEMVRRRRLREEYSWLWMLVAVAILALSVWFGLLDWLTRLIGAVSQISTFFVFGILFLVIVNIHFSMKVSTLTTQVKNLAQRLAIVDAYVREMREEEVSPVEPEGDAGSESGAPAGAGGAGAEAEAEGR